MQWTFRMFWGCALALTSGCTNGQIIEKIGKQTNSGVVLDEPAPSAGSEELNLGVIEPLGAYLETYQTSNQSEKGTAINIEPAVRRILLAKQISLDDVITTRNIGALPTKIAFRVTQPRVEIRIPIELLFPAKNVFFNLLLLHSSGKMSLSSSSRAAHEKATVIQNGSLHEVYVLGGLQNGFPHNQIVRINPQDMTLAFPRDSAGTWGYANLSGDNLDEVLAFRRNHPALQSIFDHLRALFVANCDTGELESATQTAVTHPYTFLTIARERTGTGWRVIDARLLTDNGGDLKVKTVCTRDYSVTHRDCGGTLRSLYDCDATSLGALRTLANTSRVSLPDFVPIRSDAHPSGRIQVAAY